MIFYFTIVTCSTPEFSGRLTKNCITSSFAAIIGSIILVVFGLTFAGGTCVFEIASYPMGPAIADRGSIDEGLAHSWWVWWACALNSIVVEPVGDLAGPVGC